MVCFGSPGSVRYWDLYGPVIADPKLIPMIGDAATAVAKITISIRDFMICSANQECNAIPGNASLGSFQCRGFGFSSESPVEYFSMGRLRDNILFK